VAEVKSPTEVQEQPLTSSAVFRPARSDTEWFIW
jgi:hypothetical protein